MAYDRYDPRDERPRWRDERFAGRDRGSREDRGFFERAGDEIASWFGDDDAERRHDDQRMEGPDRGFGRDRDWRREEERGRLSGRERDFYRGRFDRDEDRRFGRDSYRGFSGGEGYRSRRELGGSPNFESSYRPMVGGYTAAESLSEAEDYPRGRFGRRGWDEDGRARDDLAGSRDPHYHSWRQRQLDELDRDYDDYRRENQARFESEFGSWRERRMQKRSLLSQIREHMEVVGNDDAHVGTVDRVAGDRLILAKSDPDSGGVHHSLSCSDLDRVEGDRIILDCSAEQAKQRWRDESRSRALFEREDQGEMGDRALNRSFEGTYR